MVDTASIAGAVERAIGEAACRLRPDVRAAMEAALETEPSERGRVVLRQIVDNDDIASAEGVPLCQDTGTVWVRVALGADDSVGGDLQAAVDTAVARAYRERGLRMSVARDALCDRANTGDNTPAFLDVTLRPGTGATVTVMLKGGGSDNASSLHMLPPSAGSHGVAERVAEAVVAKASGACPPVIVGVGVGGTFDSVGKLAKHALLRPVGEPGAGCAADLEAAILERVNASGVGPGGLGGRTTALAVHVETAPCHIAGLPVAVNVGCSAMRSAVVEIA